MQVTVTTSLLSSLREEYALHLDSPRRREEYGWLLLGSRMTRGLIEVTNAIVAGGDYKAGPAYIEMDKGYLRERVRELRDKNAALSIVGFAHSHPNGPPNPSMTDLEGDSEWIKGMSGPGVFLIVTTDYDCGGVDLDWFTLTTGEAKYRRAIPTII